jgi:AraC family transcriptional regulator, regulatory protein of adaptative response / DNA-3-methyladenine glycosylase II
VRDFLAARAIPMLERVDEEGYARLDVDVRVQLSDGRLLYHGPIQFADTARRMFDVDAAPRRIAAVFQRDPLLAPLVKARPGLRVVGAWDPFECTVRAIVGQQVSVAAARTLMTRLVSRCGGVSPAALSAASLEGLGLTRSRAATLSNLARVAAEGPLDYRRLAELPGIGAWTASYVALRALGDRDAFPAADLILRKMANMTARQLEARAEAWRPFRGYAVFQLWRAS